MSNHGEARRGNSKAESETPNQGRIATAASPLHRYSGMSNSETLTRVQRQGMGSDRSIDHSPLHHHYQPSKVGKSSGGVSSPSWERKNSSEGNHGLAPSTPARSRLSSTPKGNDTPDDGPAVPKFGDWDDNDPKSAEDFSQIFQLVRDDRHSGAGKVPHLSSDGSHPNGLKQHGKENPKIWGCFSWCRK